MMVERWKDDNYKNRLSKTRKSIWENKEFKNKMIKIKNDKENLEKNSQTKRVLCFETKEIYPSAGFASKFICEKYNMKINRSAVSYAIRHSLTFPRNLFHWRYID